MGSLGSGGGSFGGIRPPSPSDSQNNEGNKRNSSQASGGRWFPLKPAATAATLALTGDTIAQLRERWVNNTKPKPKPVPHSNEDATLSLLDHNWLRALRMASYGFLLYGPGSYVWYQYLDRWMPKQTAQNVFIKVVLNQIVLGPSVIAVVFAWNNLWQGKLSELPNKYQKDALRTLLFGFRFWIPVSVVNFWCPYQACKSCCAKAQNPCHIHVLKSSTLNDHHTNEISISSSGFSDAKVDDVPVAFVVRSPNSSLTEERCEENYC